MDFKEDVVLLTERVNNYLSENNVSIREFASVVHISKRILLAWLKCDLYLGDSAKVRIETFLKQKGY